MSISKDPSEALDEIMEYMNDAAKHFHPKTFHSYVAGMIANVVGQLPPKYFEEFMKEVPCGNKGCDCHELAHKINPIFRLLREDRERTLAAREADGGFAE